MGKHDQIPRLAKCLLAFSLRSAMLMFFVELRTPAGLLLLGLMLLRLSLPWLPWSTVGLSLLMMVFAVIAFGLAAPDSGGDGEFGIGMGMPGGPGRRRVPHRDIGGRSSGYARTSDPPLLVLLRLVILL